MFVAYNLYTNTCSYYTTAYVCTPFILPANIYRKNAAAAYMLLRTKKYLFLQRDMCTLKLHLHTAIIYYLIAFTFGKHDILRYG